MKRSHLFVLLAGLLGFALSWLLYQSNWFEDLERYAQDEHLRRARLAWGQPGSSQTPAGPGTQETWVGPGTRHRVVIVAIDERTWADFAAQGEAAWPFAPQRLAQVARQLHAWGASRVGFAFPPPVASGPSAEPWKQQSLALARDASTPGELVPVVFGNPPGGASTPFVTGSLELQHDPDDVVRRFRLRREPGKAGDAATPTSSSTDSDDAPRDAFALALLRARSNEVALNGKQDWLDDAGNPVVNEARIFWSGPTGTFPRVSFSNVLADTVPADVLARFGATTPAELFADCVVLVGITWPGWTGGAADGATDAWGVRTPWYESQQAVTRLEANSRSGPVSRAATRMPTVEVQANLVQMLLQPRDTVSFQIADRDLNLKLLAVSCLIMVLAVALLPPLISALALVVVIAGTLVGFNLLFTHERLLLGSMPPVMGACITYAFGMIASWLAERREKQFIQALFGKYVSKEVARQIASSREAPKLGGERRELTVMFSDIAGFTAWSEQLGPERLLDLLNQYLGAMTDVIFEKSGTLDKFMGDAVMAFWNAPVSRKDHAARACEAALLMRSRLEELNHNWLATGLKPLGMRIGINTGECVVGNAGSGQRFDYTAFGDNVNLASRLEGTAKFYGISIVISAATYKAAGGPDRFGARHVDRVRVVGRSKPVDIFDLICTRKDLDQNPDLTRFLNAFATGVQAYFERDWPNASKAFMLAQKMRPDDGPTRVFLARIQRFSRQAPPPNWDGSVELPVK